MVVACPAWGQYKVTNPLSIQLGLIHAQCCDQKLGMGDLLFYVKTPAKYRTHVTHIGAWSDPIAVF